MERIAVTTPHDFATKTKVDDVILVSADVSSTKTEHSITTFLLRVIRDPRYGKTARGTPAARLNTEIWYTTATKHEKHEKLTGLYGLLEIASEYVILSIHSNELRRVHEDEVVNRTPLVDDRYVMKLMSNLEVYRGVKAATGKEAYLQVK